MSLRCELQNITELNLADKLPLDIYQEQTEYVYALTHNLKEPIRAISNYVSFLYEDLSDIIEGEPKKYLEGLKIAASQSLKQFEDLEELYRIKRHPVNNEPFDMKELLKGIQFMFTGIPDHKLMIAEHWPGLRRGKNLLRQILLNLISNGFKFNSSDIKRVDVGWKQTTGNRMEIFVRDNGIGIDSRYHEEIFQVFRRLHPDRGYDGIGIGLTVVKRAVQKFDGILRVESNPHRGSTFYVSLPNSIMIKT